MPRPEILSGMRFASRGLCAAAVLLFLLLQVSPLVNRVTEDESTLVYDALRVSGGEVPYRDFFSLWAPGGLYVFSGGPWGWWGSPETGTRLLQVAIVFAFTLLLLRALRRWGAWACPLAAVFPVVLFPMSPFMGNHWCAAMAYTGAVAAAGAIVEGAGRWAWFALGALSATAGCIMQTEGPPALVLVLLVVLLGRGARSLKRVLPPTLAGAAGALCLWLGPLLLRGAGLAMARDAVLWPLLNYRRPGNVADLPLLADLPDRLGSLLATPGQGRGAIASVASIAGVVAYLAVLGAAAALVLISVLHLLDVLRGKMHRGQASPAGPRGGEASVATMASILTLVGILVFSRANPTWVHLVYTLLPITLLWLQVPSDGWILRWGRFAGWAVVAVLILSSTYHLRSYAAERHALWEYGDVDRVDREGPLNRSLREVPFMRPGDTIAVLPSGGNTYLYTYPAAVGYTQLFALELGHHTVEDHRRVAEQIVRNRPKLVLFHRIAEASFMDGADPISGAVADGYVRWSESPAVAAYLRKDVAADVLRDGSALPRAGLP
jgi:hypothetical protein